MLLPDSEPPLPHELGPRRQHVASGHRQAIGAHVVEHLHGAAFVVAVVGVAIVGEVHGADGLERRRPVHGHLQGVEAAIGRAEHAHVAVAPGLLGHPGDGCHAIELLLRAVFVQRRALRVAAAAHVEARRRDPALGKVVMDGEISPIAIALAVGIIVEHDGEPARRIGPEEIGGQRNPVGHRDAHAALVADTVPRLKDGPFLLTLHSYLHTSTCRPACLTDGAGPLPALSRPTGPRPAIAPAAPPPAPWPNSGRPRRDPARPHRARARWTSSGRRQRRNGYENGSPMGDSWGWGSLRAPASDAGPVADADRPRG